MKYQMYITLAGENKIAAFSINDFGKPTLQFKKTIPGKPAPLVIDKNKKFLYLLLQNVHLDKNYRFAM